MIAVDEPFSFSIYAKDFLDEPGCRRFKYLVKIEKRIIRLQNQVKLRSCRSSSKCKFGYEMPLKNDYEHAVSIDKIMVIICGLNVSSWK